MIFSLSLSAINKYATIIFTATTEAWTPYIYSNFTDKLPPSFKILRARRRVDSDPNRHSPRFGNLDCRTRSTLEKLANGFEINRTQYAGSSTPYTRTKCLPHPAAGRFGVERARRASFAEGFGNLLFYVALKFL